MPSVHILGQILGASGFAQDKLFCKYKIIYDHKSMRLTDGDPEDQTQLSSASVGLPRIFFSNRYNNNSVSCNSQLTHDQI